MATSNCRPKDALPDHLPPNSLEAEQAAIGAALISRTAAERLVQKIGGRRDVFYLEAHRKTYDVIRDLVKPAGEKEPSPVDVLSVPQVLKDRGQLDAIGGLPYIASLAEAVPTAAHVDYYLRAVDEKWTLRKLLDIAREIQTLVEEKADDPLGIAQRVELKVRLAMAPLRANDRFDSVFTAAELARMDLPEMRWVVPGLIPEGLTILAGKGKHGKSWLMGQVSAAIALGGVALGLVPVDQGRVLNLALEDPKARLKKRQERILDGAPVPENLHWTREWKRMNQGGREAFIDWFKQYPDTRLVVIDTFAKIRSTSDARANAYDEDYRAMSEIKAIADDHGASVVVIHHFNKMKLTPSDDWVDQISGSIGISGAADTIIGFFRKSREVKEAALRVTGRDIEDETDRALIWVPHGGPWALQEGTAEEFQRTREESEVIDCLRSNGRPMKAGELATALDLKLVTVKARIYRMTARGLLINHEGWFSPAENHEGRATPVTRATGNSCNPDTPVAPDAGDAPDAAVAPTGPIPDPLAFPEPAEGAEPMPAAERELRNRVFNLAWARGFPALSLAPSHKIRAGEADWRHVCTTWFTNWMETAMEKLEGMG